MSVNDVLTCGAEPLFFLDYFATGRLDVDQAAEVVKGIAEGCLSRPGCTLLGGETAELPGFYARGEYDLAGLLRGRGGAARSIIDRGKHPPGGRARRARVQRAALQRLLAWRAVLLDDAQLALDGGRRSWAEGPLAEVLLEPTRIYVKDVLALLEAVEVKGLAHITGSGIPGNVPRCLPEGTRAVLEAKRWPRPPVFDWLQRLGGVSTREMFSTFNMGLGMVAVVPPAAVKPGARAPRSARRAGLGGRPHRGGHGEPTAVVVR